MGSKLFEDRDGLVEKLVPQHEPMGVTMVHARALALEFVSKSSSLEDFVEKLRTARDEEHEDKQRKAALAFLLINTEILAKEEAEES